MLIRDIHDTCDFIAENDKCSNYKVLQHVSLSRVTQQPDLADVYFCKKRKRFSMRIMITH